MMNSSSWRQKMMLVFMSLFFMAILCVSLWYRFEKPGLILHRTVNQASLSAANAGNGLEAIGDLMREAARHPSDQHLLLRLVEALLAVGEWQGAENFAQKALELDPPESPNPKALYLLALAYHNKGEHAQAAELLEKLLKHSENPSARYSLGILYAYYLDKPQEGRKHWQRALEEPTLSEALRKSLLEELAKLQDQTSENANSANGYMQPEPETGENLKSGE